jgi:hypothetical protein
VQNLTSHFQLYEWRTPTDAETRKRQSTASGAAALLTLSTAHARAAHVLLCLAEGRFVQWKAESASALTPTRVLRARAALRARVEAADVALADAEAAVDAMARLLAALAVAAQRRPVATGVHMAAWRLRDDVLGERERRRDAALSLHVCAALLEFAAGGDVGVTSARVALSDAVDGFDAGASQREALVCAWLRAEMLHAAVGRAPATHVRQLLMRALALYPSNALLLAVFARSERRARIANRVRRYFDSRCRARVESEAAVSRTLQQLIREFTVLCV